MKITVTAKIKILPCERQRQLLIDTMHAYKKACNFVSEEIFKTEILVQVKLHNALYYTLRSEFNLRSQMAQSVIKTVIARYKTLRSNGHDWTLVEFKRPEYDLVWNRDYSLNKDLFSVNTLHGRVKVDFKTDAMEKYFDKTWSFGTAKLVLRHKKFFLHIPVTKEIPDIKESDIDQIVGIDLGINFTAVAYDSEGKTIFFSGRKIKDQRAHYKKVRKSLQQRGTASSRRRLKAIGNKENRWMTDVNHQISKALASKYGENTLFVLEDLAGVRTSTEKVRKKNRYIQVSWAFYQLRQFIEYKAGLSGSLAIAVDPRYTSQRCPECGHIHKSNRNKKIHTFNCKNCGYISNDDRIGAMNLWQKGNEYLAKVTESAC